MDTKFDEEIRRLEIEAKLKAQEHSRHVAKIEILKHQRRILEMQATIESLDIEIEKTRVEINSPQK